MDIMFVTDTKTTVVYQTYRQKRIMYTLLPWSTVKTNDSSLYLVTLTYVFSEGKVCIADQDLSLVVSLNGVYTFLGGGDRSHGTSQIFYYRYYHNCMKPLGPHLYQMHMQWRLVL